MASERALRSRRGWTRSKISRVDGRRAETVLVVVAVVAACLVVWVLRRPDQLLHPYVWVEELDIIDRYQQHGPVHASLSPYVGYFLWPTSFSVSLAVWLDFAHLPALEYAFATAWFLATVLLLLLPASAVPLRWRGGMALLLVLVPAGPEVFGVLLYAFWWTMLWPVITLLWSKDHWWLRVPVLVVGGMSSLAGALLAIPYAVAFALGRQRRHLVGTVVLAACLVPQGIAYATSERADDLDVRPLAVAIQALRNYAAYPLTWVPDVQSAFLAFSGACLLGLLGLVALRGARREPHHHERVALLVALVLIGVLSSLPAPLISHPLVAGPRYYFLPFVVMGWLLLLVSLTSRDAWARAGCAAVLGLGALTLSQGFAYRHDPVDWSAQLDRCRTERPPFLVPVHFAGDADTLLPGFTMSPAMCERLGH